MNKSVLFPSILVSFVAGLFLASYFYLPHISIKDDLHVIDVTMLRAIDSDPMNCNVIQKNSWLMQLDVIDTSSGSVSSYFNRENVGGQSSEFHVLGVYSGSPIIKIEKSEKPIVILLSSAESTLWTIQLGQDARVKRIYTLGEVNEVRISRQATVGTVSKLEHVFWNANSSLKDIEIVKIGRKNSCKKYAYKWKPDEKGDFKYFINTARENTGLYENSFQGVYSFNEFDKPFELPVKSISIENETPGKLVDSEETGAQLNTMDFSELITGPDELIDFIEELISKNVIPAQLPSPEHGSEGRLMKFSPVLIKDLPRRSVDKDGVIECNGREAALILGDDRPNIIKCSWGDQVIYGGGGKDLIDDSWGNDIFYGGRGNDTIDAGWGSDIIIFNEGWGNDVVDKTCHQSRFSKNRTLGSTEQDYRWEYTNFIVFGKNISSKDIVWEKDKLSNKKTGDSIQFKHKCFNFVYVEDS